VALICWTFLTQVVVKRGEIPHLNQVARIVLRPGQVATENFHHDMSEVFYIVSGEGVFKYDGEERNIKVRICPNHHHRQQQHNTITIIPRLSLRKKIEFHRRPVIQFVRCLRTSTKLSTKMAVDQIWSCWYVCSHCIKKNVHGDIRSLRQVIAAAHDCPSTSRQRTTEFAQRSKR
jgi:hypothetical protein